MKFLATLILFLLLLPLRGFPRGNDVLRLTDQPQEQELVAGQEHVYELSVKAEQFFEIQVEGHSLALQLTVYAPNGQKIAQSAGIHTSREGRIVNHLAVGAGTYKIAVRPSVSQAAGRYRIKLAALRDPTETDRQRVLGLQTFMRAQEQRRRSPEEARQSVSKFQEAAQYWQAAGDKAQEGWAYQALGTVYRDLGELPHAAAYYDQALQLFRAAQEQELEIETLAFQCYVWAKQGQIGQATYYTLQLLSRSQHNPTPKAQCYGLMGRGGFHLLTGNIQEGLTLVRSAQPPCQASGDPFLQRAARIVLADAYHEWRDLSAALKEYNEALTLARAEADFLLEGYIHLRRGFLHVIREEWQQALMDEQQALALFRRLGAQDWQGEAQQLIGSILQRLGETKEAEAHFSEALKLSQSLGTPPFLPATLNELAAIASRQGRQADAEKLWQQAVAANRRLGTPRHEIVALQLSATLAVQRGNQAAAVQYYEQALKLSQAQQITGVEINLLISLGHLLLQSGDPVQARSYLQQAWEKAQSQKSTGQEVVALGGLAQVAIKEGQYHAASAQINAALAMLEAAQKKIVSPELRANYRSSSQYLHATQIDALMRLHEQNPQAGFDAQALQTFEQSQARSLVELLTESRLDIRQGVDPALLARQRETQLELAAKAERLLGMDEREKKQASLTLRSEINSLTAALREIDTQIRTFSPRYAALIYPQPLSFPEIQQKVLDENTLLLEYALGEKRSFLFVAGYNSLQSFVLPGRQEIERKARTLLARLENLGQQKTFRSVDEKLVWKQQAQQQFDEAAEALSQLLLAPAQHLLGEKRLLIVGSDVLQYVPFAALPVPGSEATKRQRKGRNHHQAVPLIVAHEILLLPSASTLAFVRQEQQYRVPPPKTLAIFAAPVLQREGRPERTATVSASPEPPRWRKDTKPFSSPNNFWWQELPASRLEAETIQKLVPVEQRMVALDFAASRATVLKSDLHQYQYLHFATHGLLDTEHPELSGLVLSQFDEQGAPQNGFLRTMDVYNLKLNADLVVLSGCRTALGKDIRGEGLIGLTRGFMYAGARRVLASLWEVNDQATAELMQRFYRSLLGPRKLSPAAALRAAQIEMWKDDYWQSPYYWATFTLQGDWR